MKKEVICTGRTVDEALEKGYAELGVDRERAEFEIITLPKKGLFKSVPAQVRVFVETSKADRAREYLSSIFEQMGLADVEISVNEQETSATLTLSGEGLGVLIGRRGETLDALQYLTGLVANRVEGDYYRIVIDSGNYREKREVTLTALAKKLGGQAARTGRSITLEPMNPYERRIIHSTIQNIEGVTSASIGEEPNRRVVISSTNPRPARPPRSGDRRPKGGDRGPRREGGRPPRGPRPDRNDRTDRPRKPAPAAAPIPAPTGAPVAAPLPTDTVPASRTAAVEEAKDKPLYSKIEL